MLRLLGASNPTILDKISVYERLLPYTTESTWRTTVSPLSILDRCHSELILIGNPATELALSCFNYWGIANRYENLQ